MDKKNFFYRSFSFLLVKNITGGYAICGFVIFVHNCHHTLSIPQRFHWVCGGQVLGACGLLNMLPTVWKLQNDVLVLQGLHWFFFSPIFVTGMYLLFKGLIPLMSHHSFLLIVHFISCSLNFWRLKLLFRFIVILCHFLSLHGRFPRKSCIRTPFKWKTGLIKCKRNKWSQLCWGIVVRKMAKCR